MIDADRTRLLRLALLKELDACGNHAVPQQALVNAMYAQVMPAPTKAEVLSHLSAIEAEDFVASIHDSLGGGLKYRITDSGRLAIHA